MEHVIKAAVERGASDIHIKAGDVFRARIDGVLEPLTKQRLSPDQTKAIAAQLILSDSVRERLDTIRDYDCSWGAPGIGRFRVNILRQRSSFMIVMRVIPFELPGLAKLQLPAVLGNLLEADSGLVLVTGPMASGKSSTVAALVHHLNTSSNRHIISLESTIEFLHRDLNSSVTQREVGVDTDSFERGLEAALRQDPDVIVLEEIRGARMAEVVLAAAETGTLVIAGGLANDVTGAVAGLMTNFPMAQRERARIRLAQTVLGVSAQRLVRRSDGTGRRVAMELMLATPELRSVLQDRRQAGELRDAIAAGRDHHMHTLEQHLADLVRAGEVDHDVARTASNDPDAFDFWTNPENSQEQS